MAPEGQAGVPSLLIHSKRCTLDILVMYGHLSALHFYPRQLLENSMTTRFSVGSLAALLASILSSSGALVYVPEMAMQDRRPAVHPLIVTAQTDIIGTWELIRVSEDIGQSDSYAFNADGSFVRTVLTQIEGSCEKVFRRTVTGTYTATADTVTLEETADATTTTHDECSPENEGTVTNGTLETLVRS